MEPCRKTVALLIEQLGFKQSYQDELWQNLREMTSRLGWSGLVLLGRRLGSSGPPDSAHRALYRLIDPAMVDGIIHSHIISNGLDSAALAKVAAGLPPIPRVGIGASWGGDPSVEVDNAGGLRELLRHLIETHGKRRIVHVRGDQGNPDAETRAATWREVLGDAGLPCDDSLLVQCHFDPTNDTDLTERLLAATGGRFDAIFAANDLIAIKLMRELSDKGYRIPEDVAVVGFDDMPACSFSDPPLSTVSQPAQSQVEWALGVLQGNTPGSAGHKELLPSRMVLRGSCGCAGHSPKEAQATRLRACDRMEDLEGEVNRFLLHMHLVKSVHDLPPLLDRFLPALGIDTYALSLSCGRDGVPRAFGSGAARDGGLPEAPSWLVPLACRPSHHAPDAGPFPASLLAPPSWIGAVRPYFLGVFPLVSGDHWLGVLLMELSPDSSYVYRTIQDQLSALLAREARIGDLIDEEVKARMATRIEVEKMRSLSGLVVGMAHQINTPLGNSLASTTLMRIMVGEVAELTRTNSLSREKLSHCINESDECLDILERSLKRTARLVASFKKLSALTLDDIYLRFDVAGLIRDELALLHGRSPGRVAEVAVEPAGEVMVESYPHLFRELVGQLFENSLVHGVPGTAGGRITIGIGIGVKDGMVSLVFGDNGRGMDSLAMEHLYEPFFTTALAEGHVGLGLHTVYNIVRQQLGGTIECKSDPRAGTCFTMVFPAKTFRPDERDTPASGPRDPLDRFH